MNKTSKIPGIDPESLLPEINKAKVNSFSSSPKTHTPYQHFAVLSPQPSSYLPGTFRHDDLVITQIKDKNKKERGRLTIKPAKRSQDSTPLKKKFFLLSKVLSEKEAYIDQLEAKLFEQNSSTEGKLLNTDATTSIVPEDKLEEKSEAQNFVREVWTRYKSRDYEILNLKMENEEFKKFLEKISEELNNHKFKLKDFEKIKKRSEDYSKEINEKDLKISILEKKIQENELELLYRSGEIEDIKHLLRSSEDKRKVAVEQLSDLESKHYRIKAKYISISRSQKDLNLSFDQLSTTLSLKEAQIKDLIQTLSQQKDEISAYQIEILSLRAELEDLRAFKRTSNEGLESKIQQIEEENKSLKACLHDLKKVQIRANTKRSETMVNNKYFNRITSQELTRAHEKLFDLEEKLVSKDLELEKMNKDCKYLVNQLESKDQVIEKMKKFVKDQSESTLETQTVSEIPKCFEAYKMIEGIIRQIAEVMSGLRCSKCFGLEDFCVNYPCGHFTCTDCMESGVEICGSCFVKISIMIPAGYSKEFLKFLLQSKKDLEDLKKLVFGT